MRETTLRMRACEATQARFDGQLFKWGQHDCVRLAAFALKELGYKPRLVRGGAYASARGARAALRRAGFDSLEAALDGLGLPRIAPAAALAGDILGFPTDDPLFPLALGVALGSRRCLMFAPPETRCLVGGDLTAGASHAWRATPCRW